MNYGSEINFNNSFNNITEEEQIILDKTDTDLNVDLNMTSNKNDMENIQMQPINVLDTWIYKCNQLMS